jgi:hypothetical protein
MSNLSLQASVKFVRADDQGEGLTTPRIPKFSMLGYSGGVIRQSWSREPVVIDLAGMYVPSVIPIVFGHDYALESVLGQGSGSVGSQQLLIDGSILSKNERAAQVVQLGDDGYQWHSLCHGSCHGNCYRQQWRYQPCRRCGGPGDQRSSLHLRRCRWCAAEQRCHNLHSHGF